MKVLVPVWLVVILGVSVLGGGAFYWYELRPSNVKKNCNTQAADKARELLKTKYELAKDYTRQKDVYYQMMNKQLFMKDDYEAYYKSCLREHGV